VKSKQFLDPGATHPTWLCELRIQWINSHGSVICRFLLHKPQALRSFIDNRYNRVSTVFALTRTQEHRMVIDKIDPGILENGQDNNAYVYRRG